MSGPVPGRPGLAGRLRQIREEAGDGDDGRAMAGRLGLPHRTWLRYERGVTVPGHVLLRFLVLTRVEPRWLLDGEGRTYRRPDPPPPTCP